jgi:signal transduction histidine kinase
MLLLVVITRWGAGRLAAYVARMRDGARPLRSWASASSGMVGIAGLTVAVPVVVGWIAGLGTPFGVRTLLLALAGSLVPLLAVTLGASLFAAVESERAQLQADLADRREETARTAARVQAVLGHEQRRLARSMHADVKAAVNAAGLMLERADHDGGVTSEVIEDAATRIATAVDRFLGGSPSALPLSDRLSEVRDLWEGVCAVTLDISPIASARLDADPVARDLIVDLVTEACANAVVHGGAGSVRVHVDMADVEGGVVGGADVGGGEVGGGEVIVDITDDGTQRDGPDVLGGRSPEQAAGMGTEVLRASCTSFSLDVAERGARLVAVVPLG